jgi:hypothetical protein
VNIKLTKRSNQILNSLIDKVGYHTKSEAMNFVMVVAYEYFTNGTVMFKSNCKSYDGEVKFHYRHCDFVPKMVDELKKDYTPDEFINFCIDIFNHGWVKGKG